MDKEYDSQETATKEQEEQETEIYFESEEEYDAHQMDYYLELEWGCHIWNRWP